MKLVVVLVGALALLVAAAAAQGVVVDGEDTTVVAAFRDFAVTFKKKYSDDAAERKALDTFRHNQLVMAEHQRLNPLATFGVTQFSDMTQEEFATLLGTAQPPQPRLTPAATTPAPAPKSCDWRSKGGVTPVLDQGMCGSSAAHSIVGSSEGVCFAKSADLIALSVHELECGTNACSGASQEQTYKYIMGDLHGHMATAASFPRTTCNVSKTVTGCTLKSYSRLPQDERALAAELCRNGPISAGVSGLQWQFYRGGIMTNCGPVTINHAATLVGYDDTAATPFWVLKNSWGTAWGDKGFIYLAKGKNTCGIKNSAYTGYVA